MDQTSYRHTLDMGEISGLGGEYEAQCQAMLEAGVEWLDSHPERRPIVLKTYAEIFGVALAENDPTRELAATIARAAKDGATGAMMQAVMTRLLYIAERGWTNYCATLREARRKALN